MKYRYRFGVLFVWIIGCLFLFHIFYQNAKEGAIADLNARQEVHAKQAASGIQLFFEGWIDTLTSASKAEDIITLNDEGKRLMEFLLLSHQKQIRAVTRVDERGRIIHTVPYDEKAIGADISYQKHIKKIMRDPKPVVSDLFVSVQGYTAIALHVPIFRGEEYPGTIAVLLDFEAISKRYIEHIRIGETGYAWMTSSEGTELFCPVPGHVGKSVFENCKDFPTILSMAKEMLKGRYGTTTYFFDRIREQHRETIKKHAVYMPVKIADSFWSIVVASSEDEVLASLANFRNSLLLVIGALFAGALFFSYYALKSWGIVKEEKKRQQAEEALRESEERLRDLYDGAPVGYHEYDKEGRITNVNRTDLEMLGYSREEMIGQYMWRFNVEEEVARLQILEKLAGLRSPGHSLERTYRRKDGTTFPVLIEDRLNKDEQGRITGIRCTIQDITERKRAEEALRESEEKAKRTAEVSSTMAEIGRIVSSTLSVEDIYEQFAVEVKKIIPFDRISIGLINREQGTYSYAYTSGIDVPARNMGKTVPLPLIIGKVIRERSGVFLLAEDEKGFPEEYPTLSVPFGVGIRSIVFAPLFSKDEVVGVLFLGSFSSKAYTERDLKLAETVTRQIGGAVASAQLYAQIKLTEEELKKSRDYLAKLFNSLADAVFTIKMPERKIESVNTSVSSLFGYTHQECIGKSTEIIYPDQAGYQDIGKQLVKAIEEGKEVVHTQQVLRRKGGELFPAEIATTFLKEQGEVRAAISIARDITERKRAEEALEEERRRLQKALDDVRTLRGIVPICASCKKIRDDKGYWNQVEKYVSEHSEAQFSHGICPECLKKLYPEFAGDESEAKT